MADQKTTKGRKCPECPARFKTGSALDDHYVKEHPVQEAGPEFYKDDSWTTVFVP